MVHKDRSVCNGQRAAPGLCWRQGVKELRSQNNIEDAVQGADFMEGDIFRFFPMDLALSLRQQEKCRYCALFDLGAEAAFLDQGANILKRAMAVLLGKIQGELPPLDLVNRLLMALPGDPFVLQTKLFDGQVDQLSTPFANHLQKSAKKHIAA